MKLTVLADNTTLIDHYYLGEPAVSYYIEDGDTKLLFDAGYSDVFIKNAETLGIDLSSVSMMVFSHGHNDHTGGLLSLSRNNMLSGCTVIAHSLAFRPKFYKETSIGSLLTEDEVAERFHFTPHSSPVQVSEHLTFLGEIPSLHDFEPRKAIGTYHDVDGVHPDCVLDDSALVFKNENGLFIITGCSHSGICNIIDYAMTVCGDDRITGVIGGFHLFDVTPQVEKTIAYLKKHNISQLYPCHCVSFVVKAELHKSIPVTEVGVGLTLEM